MAIDSLPQCPTLSVPKFSPLLDRWQIKVVFLCFAFALLVYLYRLLGHYDPKQPPLYGRGEPNLQAALQKGYDQVCAFMVFLSPKKCIR